jgi:O-antigen/teichoic acid export membrane protein
MNQEWIRFLPAFIRERIKERHLLQRTIGNTGWMLGDQIIRKSVGLLVGVWVARYLGPLLYGEFSYAVAMVTIIAPVAMLGLDDISRRNMVQDSTARDEIIGTSFVMMIIGGVAAFCLALAVIFLARPDDRLARWLVGIIAAGTIVHAFNVIEFWFESQLQWKFTVYAKTSAFFLLSIVKIGLILLQAPLVAFAWAGLVESSVGAAGLVIAYRQRGYSIKAWRFSRDTAESLLRDSWPLVFSAVLTMAYLRIDQVMLGNMVGNEELGNYSVAVQISEAWFFIPMAISTSVFPALVEADSISDELFYAHLQRLYRFMVFLAYGFALPVMFYADKIMLVLFSSAYAEAGPLLAILAWTGVFTSLGSARELLILEKNWTKVGLLSIALGGAANILLNIFLIPYYGALGAVVATIISYWAAVHGTCFLFKPLRKTGWMMTKAMLYPKFW